MVNYLAVFAALFLSFNVCANSIVADGGDTDGTCKVKYGGYSYVKIDATTLAACHSAVREAHPPFDDDPDHDILLDNYNSYTSHYSICFLYESGNCVSYGIFQVFNPVFTCSDPAYPYLKGNKCYDISDTLCPDGYNISPTGEAVDYDDAVIICDRALPTYKDCSFGQVLIDEKPLLPYCKTVEITEPDDSNGNNCTPVQSGNFNTYMCKVEPSDVCSPSGICKPGCGYVNDEFYCFIDDENDLDDLTSSQNLDIPDDAVDLPYVDGSCRKINDITYCPQDESDYIQDDGTYPAGCGYVDEDFYCDNNRVFVSGVDTTQDFESLPEDASENALLAAINNNLQSGFTKVSNNIGQIENSLGSSVNTVNDSINNLNNDVLDSLTSSSVSTNNKLDDVISSINSLDFDNSAANLDYDLPTSNTTDIFDGVVGDDVIKDVNNKIDLALAEYDEMLEDTKALFNVNTSSGFADSGYVENVVNIKGVSVDLGASALDRFTSDYGIEHIIWLIVALTGLFIITGGKS